MCLLKKQLTLSKQTLKFISSTHLRHTHSRSTQTGQKRLRRHGDASRSESGYLGKHINGDHHEAYRHISAASSPTVILAEATTVLLLLLSLVWISKAHCLSTNRTNMFHLNSWRKQLEKHHLYYFMHSLFVARRCSHCACLVFFLIMFYSFQKRMTPFMDIFVETVSKP